ncbi:hypothetical protein CSHISOI_04808 [Colletotrichum shisoi]|uniref:C3H1-type domain-containing protein n=1 Tax=Colletotrichum shisoi TaxID=2078593 RepID=A0A5Q4BVM0_9PEZI|nr:hypothetical protein CSHISOI_04808 [Colletotrichum shisoi]
MEANLNNSSSDKSCSPPVSRGSTRDTTPDFSPSVSHAFSNLGIESFSRSSHMDASTGRYKTPQMMFRPPNCHVEGPNSAAPRRVDAISWRGDYGMGPGQGRTQRHYHSLSSARGPDYLMMASPVLERQMGREADVNTTGFYAYCLDRGNGNYTRLIPADLLPPLMGIPAVQDGAYGMLALPPPQGLDPQDPAANPVQPVAFKRRIDHIVASTPTPPKKPKIYCDKWVHEGVCAFTQQGCKYKHEMPLDKATQNSLGLFHGLPAWWKKQQAELQRQQSQALLEQNNDTEAFFDPRPHQTQQQQQQQSGLVSSIKVEKGHTGPARASQSWRRTEGVRLEPQGQMSSMPLSTRQTGGYRHSSEQRPAYHQNIDSPASSCVWGPIGPPSKQTLGQGQIYPQGPDNFSAANNFALLRTLGDSLGERDDDVSFESY